MKRSSSSSPDSSSDAISYTAASTSASSSATVISPTPILKRNNSASSSTPSSASASASASSSESCYSESDYDQAITRSLVWKGFTKVAGSDAVTCNKCHLRLSHTSASGTGTMWTHMKNCNRSLYNQLVLAFRLSVFSPAFRDAWTVIVPCLLWFHCHRDRLLLLLQAAPNHWVPMVLSIHQLVLYLPPTMLNFSGQEYLFVTIYLLICYKHLSFDRQYLLQAR